MEETRELMDRLEEHRARRQPHPEGRAYLGKNGSFDWLPIDEFEQLTRTQREAYLRRLADHLEKDLALAATA